MNGDNQIAIYPRDFGANPTVVIHFMLKVDSGDALLRILRQVFTDGSSNEDRLEQCDERNVLSSGFVLGVSGDINLLENQCFVNRVQFSSRNNRCGKVKGIIH